jgi:hypothetical protein
MRRGAKQRGVNQTLSEIILTSKDNANNTFRPGATLPRAEGFDYTGFAW